MESFIEVLLRVMLCREPYFINSTCPGQDQVVRKIWKWNLWTKLLNQIKFFYFSHKGDHFQSERRKARLELILPTNVEWSIRCYKCWVWWTSENLYNGSVIPSINFNLFRMKLASFQIFKLIPKGTLQPKPPRKQLAFVIQRKTVILLHRDISNEFIIKSINLIDLIGIPSSRFLIIIIITYFISLIF